MGIFHFRHIRFTVRTNSSNEFNISFTTVVLSAEACATKCYNHRCTMAIFDPTAYHSSEFGSLPGIPCTLAMEPKETCKDFERITNHSTKSHSAIRIGRVKCGKL